MEAGDVASRADESQTREASSVHVLTLNCSLKGSSQPSSTQVLVAQLASEFERHGCVTHTLRVADFAVKPGVSSDEGKGDEWPLIRAQVLAADILVLASPIWLGQPSSVAKRVLERMDAFLSETDEAGRYVSYGKVAAVAVVGNEDGAHHVSAELFQALNEVGFTIPASAVTYWVGEAMQTTDYIDLDHVPEKTARATAMVARNSVHLARLLRGAQYPGGEQHKEQ